MKTILVVCSSGLGTSLMVCLSLEAIFREAGLEVNIVQTDSSSMAYYDAHIIVGARQVIESLTSHSDVETVALDRITDRNHIKERIMESSFFQEQKER